MIQLNLDDHQAEALNTVLQIYLSDLRAEIGDTDRLAMRQRLKDREEQINAILAELGRQGVS